MTASRSSRIRRYALVAIVAAATVAVDQTTKALAIGGLSQERRIPLLGDLLGLQLAFNPGAVFSLGSDATGVITVVGVLATVALAVAAARTRSTMGAVAFGFILGGAVGNLIDRLFSPPAFGRGHVTDFLAYGDLFIGNLADVFLGIGAVLLLIGALRPPRRTPQPDPAEDEDRRGAVASEPT